MRTFASVVLAVASCLALAACAATTRPATGVTAGSAALNAAGRTDSSAAHYYFQYATAPQALGTGFGFQTPSQNDIPANTSGPGGSFLPFSEAVTRLQPDTTYYYRVCGGDMQVSPDVCAQTESFKTPDGAAFDTPGTTAGQCPPASRQPNSTSTALRAALPRVTRRWPACSREGKLTGSQAPRGRFWSEDKAAFPITTAALAVLAASTAADPGATRRQLRATVLVVAGVYVRRRAAQRSCRPLWSGRGSGSERTWQARRGRRRRLVGPAGQNGCDMRAPVMWRRQPAPEEPAALGSSALAASTGRRQRGGRSTFSGQPPGRNGAVGWRRILGGGGGGSGSIPPTSNGGAARWWRRRSRFITAGALAIARRYRHRDR